MLKNTYFLEKDVKNRLSVGGSAPEPSLFSDGWELRPPDPPRCYSRLILQLCRVYF